MTSYTITVAPSDDSSTTAATTTTITVDTSSGDVLITDVHLHAAAGLTATRLPSIDISLLMQAITSPPALTQTSPAASPALTDKPAQTIPTAVQPVAEDDTTLATASDSAASGTAPVTDVPAPAQPAKTANRTATPGRRRTAKEPAVPTPPATTSRSRRRTDSEDPKSTTATPKRKPRAARDETPATGRERTYRRMPDDFTTVATRLNSASAIAEHYQVPRHTAQGWLRRLRTAAAS
jgi:hypothetical protein